MAEALVKSFLQRLNSLISQENEASPGLQDQIQKLKNRLEEIGSILGEAGRSKQEDGLACSWESDLIETVHHTENCIDQYASKTRSQDGSDPALSIVQFCSELEEIDARLAGISSQRSQINMVPASEGKEENGQSSSIDDDDDVDVGEDSLAPFALNYSSLPSYLRSCLLYCSLIPGKISRGRLVRLLVAQGMFQERPGDIMEDIAEKNINELVHQGMLRVKIDTRYVLQIVDPYRRICQSKLRQGERITRYLGSDSNFLESFYIGLIHYHGETITASLNDLQIESLFVIPVKEANSLSPEYWHEGIPDDHWACVRNALYTLKFLRVLDLEGLKIKSLPEEIGDLIHLRYLGLKCSALDEIPESIGNLQNLETLDIRWPRRLKVLPNGVLALLKLRHLKMPVNEIKVPSGIGRLAKLQSLTGLFVRHGIMKELSSLTQLRELELLDVSIEHARELSASIMKMRGLLSLSLDTRCWGESELLPTLEPFSPPPLIRKLRLDGHLAYVPEWVCSMENLTKLRLGFSYLSEEAISVLQFLPNLKRLELWEASQVKEINKEFCRMGGFPKLEVLIIASRNLLEWTEIEEGAFPSLAFLYISNCPQLMDLPEGLQHVTTLKVLMIVGMHPDHERRLKRDGGKENYKIKHIPKLRFYSSASDTWVAM